MSGDRLRVEYGTLSEISRSLTNEAHEIDTVLNQLTGRVDNLMRQGWSGQAAQKFQYQFQETAVPATKTLSHLLAETGDLLLQLIRIYQEADQEVGALFKNRYFPESGTMAQAGAGSGPGGAGHAVDITQYKSGTDGWSLISMDGSKGFSPNRLVAQVGSTCALYGPLNLLIESGYDIGQPEADTYADIKKMQEAWWRPDMWLDDDPNWGFDMDVSESVVSKWTSHFQRGDFKTGWFSDPDSAKAEQFLVNTVQGGKPVMVNMGVDESFGLGSGGHDATVIGVKTDANGKLQSVLMATNWSGQQIYEIPAKSFMDDWMSHSDGEYLTVDHAPVVPKPVPNPNEFSAQLAHDLDQEDWAKSK